MKEQPSAEQRATWVNSGWLMRFLAKRFGKMVVERASSGMTVIGYKLGNKIHVTHMVLHE